MSATNVNRETTAADYLNWLRIYQQQMQAKNSAGTNFTPDYILIISDTINITDTLSNNANLQTFADTINITDTSLVLTSLLIQPNRILLNDATSRVLLNDGTSFVLLNDVGFVIDTATIGFSEIR